MEEKDKNTDKVKVQDGRLTWEVPRLISLDKGKTNNGYAPGTPEDTSSSDGS